MILVARNHKAEASKHATGKLRHFGGNLMEALPEGSARFRGGFAFWIEIHPRCRGRAFGDCETYTDAKRQYKDTQRLCAEADIGFVLIGGMPCAPQSPQSEKHS